VPGLPCYTFDRVRNEPKETTMASMFQFVGGGVGVMPDPQDNPDGHVVPHHDAGTRISFEVLNVGDAAGVARVGVELEDNFVTEWSSRQLAPGESTADFVSLGRLSPGDHAVLVFVNPGSGQADHETNRFGVG
jgi:hypothetical protein